jgi:hypothetical protein
MIRSFILLNKAIDVQRQVDFRPIDFASQAIVTKKALYTRKKTYEKNVDRYLLSHFSISTM